MRLAFLIMVMLESGRTRQMIARVVETTILSFATASRPKVEGACSSLHYGSEDSPIREPCVWKCSGCEQNDGSYEFDTTTVPAVSLTVLFRRSEGRMCESLLKGHAEAELELISNALKSVLQHVTVQSRRIRGRHA